MPGEYVGKIVIVTGAARGLGAAFVAELRERGATVVGIDQVDADVASGHALESIAREIRTQHGQIDLLICNAGISISAPFEKTDANDFERVIQVNFLGVVNGCRAFLPILRRPGGQIVNVSSCFAWTGYPGKTAYAASKAAVRAFSESLRLELKRDGIGVTTLYPGAVRTGIVRSGISATEEQRAREAAFLEQRGFAPEHVARLAINRLRGNPLRIVIGRDYWMLDLLTRISPALTNRIVGAAAERTGF
jgi:NAD(P)-dependent dehydrogenase (short-subunit alcohol dehydrogenase family)